MERMKAVGIVGTKRAELIEMDKPSPKRNEILVKVLRCGICTWDQRVFVGEKKVPLPLVGGHEVIGTISEVGEGVDPEQYQIGSMVAVRVVKSCHSCYYCRRDLTNMCIELNTLSLNGPDVWGMGGFAQYICVDRSEIWHLDKEVSMDDSVLIEPIACVVNSYKKASPRMGDDILVIGGGPMGLVHVMLGKLYGCRVILSEPDEARRKIAAQLGCDITIDPIQENLQECVMKLTENRGAEIVFNTTAIAALAEQAVTLTAPNGTCLMYSSMHPDHPIQVSPNMLHSTQMVLTGAVSPSVESFDIAVNLVNKGILKPHILLTETINYKNCQKAFEEAVSAKTLRVAFDFEEK